MPRIKGSAQPTVIDQWAKYGYTPSQAAKRGVQRYLFRLYQGNRKYISRAFADQAAGYSWVAEIRNRQPQSEPAQATLTNLGRTFADSIAAAGRSPSHVRTVRQTLDMAVAAGLDAISDPTWPAKVQAWLAKSKCMTEVHLRSGGSYRKKSRPLTPATRNKRLRILRSVCNHAVKSGIIGRSPLMALPRFNAPSRLKGTFDLAELRLLLKDPADPWFLVFALLIYTGCRIQEALHLRWQNISFSANVIEIRSSGDYRLKREKERTVPLQAELADILQPLHKSSGYVLPADLRQSKADHGRRLQQFLKRHKILEKDRTPHSTRHTWISLLLAQDCNALQVAAWAGHSSLLTTQGYSRTQERYRQAVSTWPRGTLCLLKDPDPKA